MALSNFVYSFVLFVLVHSSPMPPTILKEPGSDTIFDPRVSLELPCVATGDPSPMYSWTKNGQSYEPNAQDKRVLMATESGSLTFTQPEIIDQGLYQCNATNIWGTAVSQKIRIRLAQLEAFPIYDRAQVIQVQRGDSLRIPCKPPSGVPDPEIYWTDNTNAAEQFGFRISNARIQQDEEGNLYFLNVKDEDEQKQFICNVFSRKLNVIRRGVLTELKVIKSEPIVRQPTKLWTPEVKKIFLKNQTLVLKCIFGGLPTPDVVWRKTQGTLPEARSTVNLERQELIITNLQYDDAGVYECRGQNEMGYDLFTVNVQIDASPNWISKPKDVQVVEGETVEFNCHADGRPGPLNIQWFINGISMQDPRIAFNPRRRIRKNRLTLHNVAKSDTAVYQCNVSNIYGSLFANFYVNVITDKPSIQRGPEVSYRIVEGRSIVLPCEISGTPLPKVIWMKRDRIINGGRYSISKNGSLTIRDASISDSGIYLCNATNKFGSTVRNTTVTVKKKTRIQTRPNSQEIRRGHYAIFRCTAVADPSLNITIDWYKEGKLLSYTGRFIKSAVEANQLKIVDVQFDDAGTYVCRASTEFDFDDASATLVVQDRPNRPKIKKVSCNGTSEQPFAVVQWEGTGDNHASVLYYELQYNTTFTPNDWVSVPIEQRKEIFNEVKSADGSVKLEPKTTILKTKHLPANQNDLRVLLSCWTNYTFRVIAYNHIGASDPSPVSPSACQTSTCQPKSNPNNVRALTTQASPLIIEWESLPAIKRGAPQFWYEVNWRQSPAGKTPEAFLTQRVYPPEYKFVVPNSVLNVRYEYYVRAVNQQPGGTNLTYPLEPAAHHFAFAGDAAPIYVSRNFRVLQMLDSTTVQFGWSAPSLADQDNIRGVLKGYQIEIFRLDDPENSRRVISDISPNQTSITVFNAPPNADVGAHIRIETERYLGETSPVIQFPTREGRPGPVINLRGVPSSNDGIFLLWDSPEDTNGVIIGYQIDYKTIEGIASQPSIDQPSILLRDDTRRSYILGGLKPDTKYRVQVRARTSVGLSISPAIIELITNLSLGPSQPTFLISDRGPSSFNVSFDPTIMTIPGSHYYVQYRANEKNHQAEWNKSYSVSNDRTILVNGLKPGTTYTVVLVASDGITSETKSDPKMVTTASEDRAPRVITSPWFIGLIVAAIVLIIIIAIVCGIMRRKGGKYSAGQSTPYDSPPRIQDKEMLHGPSEYGGDDGKFSEYYRAPSDVSIRQSRISLQNGDDRDSMAEFNDDKDRGRFTEDGSFIGQYGRDDKRRTYLNKYDESEGFTNDQDNSPSPV